MPIKKIDIPPGVDRQRSPSQGELRWYYANNVRFNDMLPESVGGWVEPELFTLKGIGRAVHSWSDFQSNVYTCVATNMKYYLLSGADQYDITPNRDSGVSIGSNKLFTTNLSNIVTVNHASHGASAGDFVVFDSVASDVGGFLTTDFLSKSEGFQVHTVTDFDNYTIVMDSNATSTVSGGGGAVTVSYKIGSGGSAGLSGFGYGTGAYGGDDIFPTEYGPLPLNPLASFDTSQSYTLNITGTGLTVDTNDWIYIQGLTGTVNGVDTTLLNNKWWKHALGSSSTSVLISFTGYTSGASPDTGGGSGVTLYHFDSSAGTVVGASRHWGEASDTSAELSSFRTVSVGNFGEDLIFANRGGPIYYYDVSSKTSSGVPATGEYAVELSSVSGSVEVPVIVGGFCVSDSHGHVIAWSTNDVLATTQNNMLIRWCDRNNPFDWMPADGNEAGGEILRHGSTIIRGIPTRDEVVLFTDTAVYSMRYVGAPEFYGVFLVTTGVGLYAQNACVSVDNSVFFMGNNQFYVYDGKVNVLEKSLSAYVFEDINSGARETIFCGSNSQFSEVVWFYPAGDSIEPNKWVSYNYSNGTWSSGLFDMAELTTAGASGTKNRTSWSDSGVTSSPMATFIRDYDPDAIPANYESGLYLHEVGRSAGSSEMLTEIESDEFEISDGDRIVYWDRVIPDIDVFGIETGIEAPSLSVTVSKRDLPGSSKSTKSTMTLTYASDGETYTPDLSGTSKRGRGRFVTLKISGSISGFGWRADSFRFSLRPDGRR